MTFGNPYWKLYDKLDILARWIIMHSIIYYELDGSLVTDEVFDKNCGQYVTMAKKATLGDLKRMRWGYVMKDFDGSTGYHLPRALTKDHKDYLFKMCLDLVEYKGGLRAEVSHDK